MHLFILIVATIFGLTGANRIFQLEQVTSMLGDMHQKCINALEKEEAQMVQFNLFCTGTSTDRGNQIATGAQDVDDAKSQITIYTAKAAESDRIANENVAQIAVNKQDMENARVVRDKEKAASSVTIREYSEALDAVTRAIRVLNSKSADRAAKATSLLSEVARRTTNVDLSNALDDLPSASEKAYEFSSGGIVGMLEKMQEKFVKQRTDAEMKEAKSQNAFDMFNQDLLSDNEHRQETADRESKNAILYRKKVAEGKTSLLSAEEKKRMDEEFKANLDATCSRKNSDFKQRRSVREEELSVILKVIDILKSGSVGGAANKHGVATLFYQALRRSSIDPSISRHLGGQGALIEAGNILRRSSVSLKSTVLANIANTISDVLVSRTHAAPLEKVIKMIADLKSQLEAQAAAEHDQKSWCDANLKQNEKERDQFASDVSEASTNVDEQSATIAKRSSKISTLTDEIQKTSESLATSKAQRASEHAENLATIADADGAVSALSNAISLVEDFYAKNKGVATSFVQEPTSGLGEGAPEIFDDEPYRGLSAESGGIVGFLRTIQSDFARLSADTKSQEEKAAESQRQFETEANQSIAVNKKDVEGETKLRAQNQASLAQFSDTLKQSNVQLDTAKETFEKLKPSCIATPVDYAARTAQREQEIQSLSEAIKVLEGELSAKVTAF